MRRARHVPGFDAGMPERPKGADCKSAGNAFGGSNPSPGTGVVARLYNPGCEEPLAVSLWSGCSGRETGSVSRTCLGLWPRHAPLAQLAERLHGKEEVSGSNPEGGSETGRRPVAIRGPQSAIRPCGRIEADNGERKADSRRRRRSSVGKSARLIIERSAVQVCPPLQK